MPVARRRKASVVGTNTVIGVEADVSIVDRLGPMMAACKPSRRPPPIRPTRDAKIRNQNQPPQFRLLFVSADDDPD